jgi:hypothetical protein
MFSLVSEVALNSWFADNNNPFSAIIADNNNW